MIHTYGITQQGDYHIKNNIACQDAHIICKITDSIYVAAVADGLGSETHSDIASRIAVDTFVRVCKEGISDIPLCDDKTIGIIHTAFDSAYQAILCESQKNNQDANQYDTTLCGIVLIGSTVYYGQSGDSGIVALMDSGEYISITKQQRDNYGYVYPLCFADKWEFGKKENVASVLLATDGVLGTLFPALLINEPVNIYVALAQFLMDFKQLGFGEVCYDEIYKRIYDFVSNIPSEAINGDDKTVVCLVNSDVEVSRKNDEYYKVPNWEELKKKRDDEFFKLAYPHLCQSQDVPDVNSDGGKTDE